MRAQHRHVQRRVQPLIGRIDRRTRVQQGAHDGGASGLRRPVQRGAVAPAHGARFGPRLEQQRDQLRVAPARGPVQRGDHVAIDRVDVCALADEKHRELAVSVFLRPMQQGGAVGMLSGRRSAAGEERTDRIGVAALGGLEESGAQTRAGEPGVHAPGQHQQQGNEHDGEPGPSKRRTLVPPLSVVRSDHGRPHDGPSASRLGRSARLR